MNSSDYFSKVYEPKKKISNEVRKRLQKLEQAEKKADLVKMLDWLYDSTNRAFERIPESTLRSFAPDYISFRFFHKNSGNYIQVQLVKYLKGENQFGIRNKETKMYNMPFQRNFKSTPKRYQDDWTDPITMLCNGYFEATYGIKDTGIVKDHIGKYKAVYYDPNVANSNRIEKFTRKL